MAYLRPLEPSSEKLVFAKETLTVFDVILPIDFKLYIKEGQQVYAVQTVIAEKL